MPYRHRLLASAALGIVAVTLVVLAPRVSVSIDGRDRAIGGISLINDVTRRPILGLSPLTDGTVVDLARLANLHLSLQATIAGGVVPGSVAFTMTGATAGGYRRTEARAPYFLCGDYVDCPELVTPGVYTVTVQAYPDASAVGFPLGKPFVVRFTVAATAPTTTTATADPPLDVLFVGNSLLGTANGATGEDTPTLVRHLALINGRRLNVTKVIHYGYTLRHTWNDGLVAAALSGTRKYDFIVLQEYSTLVATSLPDAKNTLLNLYAPTFARALKPGGRVVLFKNWALAEPSPFASRAAAKAAVDTNYAALSAALPTPNLLAPIGDEFETIIAAKSTRYLIVADGKHPNDAAIYLDAVTLYGIVFGQSPRDLADLYLPTAVASYLRAVATTAIGY
jgi:hypothetical protein